MNEQDLKELLMDWFTAVDLKKICAELSLDWELVKVENNREETVDNLMAAALDAGKALDLVDQMTVLRPNYVGENAGLENTKAGVLGDHPTDQSGPPQRVVSTGFTDDATPMAPIDPKISLQCSAMYYFWLEVGEPVENSAEVKRVVLDVSELPPEAKLQVALFSFEGELGISEGADVGELLVNTDGTVSVATPVVKPSRADAELLGRRLFFPVSTPKTEGTYKLRCNIYYQQILLQSRLVTAKVTMTPQQSTFNEALVQVKADYVISKSLDSSKMAKMPDHAMSIMLNSNGEGTHGFRFFGGSEFKNDASFTAGELNDLLEKARGALRLAAWGDDKEYSGQAYRYTDRNVNRLKKDLIRCAVRGYRFYDAMVGRIGGRGRQLRAFESLLANPGQLQIAHKESPGLVFPAALIYDYPVETTTNFSDFKLCAEFEKNLRAGNPLEETACFQGNCPTKSDVQTVCPSGFWGYRHAIGMPITIPNVPDPPVEVPLNGTPEISMAVSTDPAFRGRAEHEAVLKGLMPGLKFNYADERAETVDFMQTTSPHVFYFFCHGRLVQDTPSLEVGPPKSKGIFRETLRLSRVFWEDTQPLVILNGCHTAALLPERAIDLVSGFIDTANAAGVIGTEITNFVPVARIFGEECLRRFFVEKQTIGEAVRGGRLAVLQEANPLGLMYVPYVMTGLRLVA